MKIVNTTIATALILGALTAVSANENVDTKIAQIKAAPPQERVQLMNEFKMELSTMNAQDRADAISQLRAKTQTGTQTGMENTQGTIVQNQARRQEMRQADQMNQMQNMNQRNQMVQQHMGQMADSMPMNPGAMPTTMQPQGGTTQPQGGTTMPSATR